MSKTQHDRIAEALAKKKGATYPPGKGADVVTPTQAIEVEVDQGKLGEGMQQLQGYRKQRYLAVPTNLVEAAKEKAKGTQVGVMDETGRIRKRAGGKNK
jgi:hypothetical protein